jgi:glycerophosphoryl diester phosphodiesterase
VLTVAHRGASGHAPENTLSAVRRAVAMGVDMVEVDVQRTKDGVLVLMHDATLLRTTDVRRRFPKRRPWRVTDFTFDEIATLDAGSWMAYAYSGEPVPTLGETLLAMRASRAGLLLEVKRPENHPHIIRDLVRELASSAWLLPTGANRPLVVQSFDIAAMKELKTLAPQIPVGLLGRPRPGNLPALATWADQVNPFHRAADAAYVARVHSLGMGCLLWTVDDESALRRAAGLGADGIITNRPDRLRSLSRPEVSTW